MRPESDVLWPPEAPGRRLSIVTGVCGSIEVTEQWFRETLGRCAQAHEVIVVAQAETDEEAERLRQARAYFNLRGWNCCSLNLLHPKGSSAAFNLAWRAATGDIVAMLHNDLMVKQPGWDVTVAAWFRDHPKTGVAGFHGAGGIGAHDIYKTPYRLMQLARWDTVSNLEDAEVHGGRADQPRAVAVLDGLALIARRVDLEAWGGFDERYVHHMYDSDLCLRAMLDHGRTNYMLPIVARHLNGQTANMSRYGDWLQATGRGTDGDIHTRSHEIFYERWRGKLPVEVS